MTAPDDQIPDNAAADPADRPELAGATAKLLRGLLLNGRQGLVEGLADIGYRLLSQAKEASRHVTNEVPHEPGSAEPGSSSPASSTPTSEEAPSAPETETEPATEPEPEPEPRPGPGPKLITEPVRGALRFPPNLIGPGSLLGGDFKRQAPAAELIRYPAGLIGSGSLWSGDFKRRAVAAEPLRYPAGLIGPGSLWVPEFCRTALPASRLVLPALAGSLWLPEFAGKGLPGNRHLPEPAPEQESPYSPEEESTGDLQWWEIEDPLPAADSWRPGTASATEPALTGPAEAAPAITSIEPQPAAEPSGAGDDASSRSALPGASPEFADTVADSPDADAEQVPTPPVPAVPPIPESLPALSEPLAALEEQLSDFHEAPALPEQSVESPSPWAPDLAGITEIPDWTAPPDIPLSVSPEPEILQALPALIGSELRPGPAIFEDPARTELPETAAPRALQDDDSGAPKQITDADWTAPSAFITSTEKGETGITEPIPAEIAALPVRPAAATADAPPPLDVAALFSPAPEPLPPEKIWELAKEETSPAPPELPAPPDSGPMVLPPDFFAATAPLPPPSAPAPVDAQPDAPAEPPSLPVLPPPVGLPGNPFLTAAAAGPSSLPFVPAPEPAPPPIEPMVPDLPPMPAAPLQTAAPEPVEPGEETPPPAHAAPAVPDFSSLPGEMIGTGRVPPLPETNLDPEQIWKLAAEELTPRPLSTPIPPWMDQPALSAPPPAPDALPAPAVSAVPAPASAAPHPFVSVGTSAPEPALPMTVPVPPVAAAVPVSSGQTAFNPFAATGSASAAQVPWSSPVAAPAPPEQVQNGAAGEASPPGPAAASASPSQPALSAEGEATPIPMTLWRDVPPNARPAKIVTRQVVPVEKSHPFRSVALLLAVIGGLMYAGWYFRDEVRGWLDRIINGSRKPRPARTEPEKAPANPTVMRALDDPAASPATAKPAVLPPANNTTAAPAKPAPPAADPAIVAAQIAEARAVAERLLRAAGADEIAPLVREGAAMKERIAAWLSARSTIPGEEWSLEYDRIKSTPTAPEPACVFRVVTKARPSGYSLMVEKTPQGWLVEWDLYAQCRDDSLTRFLTDPAAPAQPFFVHLQRSHYFGKDRLPPSEQERLLVFKVLPPDARPLDEGGFVFVTRGTRLAKFLEEKLPDSAWDQVISPMVELVRRNGRIEIQKVVRMTWRRPVKAEEAVQ